MVPFKAAEGGGGGTVWYCKSFCKHGQSNTFSLYEARKVMVDIMYRFKM